MGVVRRLCGGGLLSDGSYLLRGGGGSVEEIHVTHCLEF